jgi:hypothetical protein
MKTKLDMKNEIDNYVKDYQNTIGDSLTYTQAKDLKS